MKNSLFGTKTRRRPDASDRVGNDRLRGQQIRVDSQPDARGAGGKPPDVYCA